MKKNLLVFTLIFIISLPLHAQEAIQEQTKVEKKQTQTKAKKWLTRATIALGGAALAVSAYFGYQKWDKKKRLENLLTPGYVPFPEIVLDGYTYDDIMWLLNNNIAVTGHQSQRFGPNWLFEISRLPYDYRARFTDEQFDTILKRVIERVDVNRQRDFGTHKTALMEAISLHKSDAVNAILKYGKNLNVYLPDTDNHDALWHAEHARESDEKQLIISTIKEYMRLHPQQ